MDGTGQAERRMLCRCDGCQSVHTPGGPSQPSTVDGDDDLVLPRAARPPVRKRSHPISCHVRNFASERINNDGQARQAPCTFPP